MKLPLWTAELYARQVLDILRPHCEKIAFAGSVRRRKRVVGDLEIVCIPKREADLFGNDAGVSCRFKGIVDSWGHVRGAADGKYMRRVLPPMGGLSGGFECDIFMASPDNFGWILALRTGPDNFNRGFWLPRLERAGFASVDGFIVRRSDFLRQKVPTEKALFALLGCEFIKPNKRI